MLQIQNISKSFGVKPVLIEVSLTVQQAEIVALLGPSGCGKTTLLRIVAGLEQADSGRLLLEGIDLINIPVHRRNFGMVFQDYALFPHMSVAKNVAFGLKMADWDPESQRQRISQVMELVGLSGFEERMVFELSGGEQQRVALARSIAPLPRLLLLDEPLGALDRSLRERLMGDLRNILKHAMAGNTLNELESGSEQINPQEGDQALPDGITSIYVTHDQEEAFAIADRVFIMNRGQIEQSGHPVEIYRRPKSSFVARFLGMNNLLKARIVGADPPKVGCELGNFNVTEIPENLPEDPWLLIRPEAAEIIKSVQGTDNAFEGILRQVSFRGLMQQLVIDVETVDGKMSLHFAFDSNLDLPAVGETVAVRLNAKDLLLLQR